jgi:protein-tyrosine-phosphatase
MTAFYWTRFDVIAAPDQNVLNILSRSKPAKAKVVLFNAPDGIADPDYGDRLGFQRMFEQISQKTNAFLVECGLMKESDFVTKTNSEPITRE